MTGRSQTDKPQTGLGIEGVIFDKDGTLFDFASTWEAWAKAFLLRMTGGDTPRASVLGAAIGFDLDAARFAPGSIVIAGTPEEIADALVPHLAGMTPAQLIGAMNQEAASARQSEAVPLAPLLRGLRARGLRLGVATNDAEAPARAHLAGAGVLDAFDFIAGSDSGHGAKPGPGQISAFARQQRIAPGRIVMVGDSLHDLRAGRAGGTLTVGVLTGLADRETLDPLADAVLRDIGELPGWLDQRAAGG